MARPITIMPESIKKANTEAIVIRDDSLLEYHICKGDTVIVDADKAPVPGKIALIDSGNGATLTMYWNQPFEQVKAVAIGLVRRFAE